MHLMNIKDLDRDTYNDVQGMCIFRDELKKQQRKTRCFGCQAMIIGANNVELCGKCNNSRCVDIKECPNGYLTYPEYERRTHRCERCESSIRGEDGTGGSWYCNTHLKYCTEIDRCSDLKKKGEDETL